MALTIHLKPGGQAIINGAVVENASTRSVRIAVQNAAAVLRGEDILDPAAAVTPASRIYYALQCLYLFAERTPAELNEVNDLLESYVSAAPSSKPLVETVRSQIGLGNFYAALKQARKLISHEREVLNHVHERFIEAL